MCPDRFYVTVKRGEQTGFLLGPYETHEEALANVDRARQLAHDVDPFSAFDAFGTARSKMLIPAVFRNRV
jgi:hypothetical protein